MTWGRLQNLLGAGGALRPVLRSFLKHACDVTMVQLVPGVGRPYGLGQLVAGWLQVLGTLELASPD